MPTSGRGVTRAAAAPQVAGEMHSYMEQMAVPMHAVEERRAGERRPMRVMVVAATLAAMACAAVLLAAGEGGRGGRVALEAAKPKFVDWKKEDAGSDDMNLHLKVADALAKADGLSQTGLSPVPEGLLKMAQRAAEEQKTMPGVVKKAAKPKISASLEKMFQQAMDEQHVEKVAKEGHKSKQTAKKAAAAHDKRKEEAAKRVAAAHTKAAASAKEEKSTASKLLDTVSAAAPKAAAPKAAAPKATATAAKK
eukprot:CAMPEP_0174915464 /NCGR_PEP_ID=MMETSP1355-20121228/1113_1 /TAXON_ID=464990 /ORGANISM="Hemiselmis tepida, Strain CCMP443" /LENGTH=250 /DNA_ID=CAMNT_0016160349 /DNA_START=71 /DNA_END=823 /DNA_ORIENTATION=-